MVFGHINFREEIKLKWGPLRYVLIQPDWCPYKKGLGNIDSKDLLAQRDNHMYRQQEKAICKPQREASEEKTLHGT